MNKTKVAIFEAAIKEFSSNGYNGATVDDIALKAGVAKGTLYYHFKSKEDIFKYIIKEGMKKIKQDVQDEVEKVEEPISKLKTLCRVQLKLVYENRDFFKVIMSQIWGKELRQLELRETVQKYVLLIEQYIEEAIRKGVVRDGNSSFMAYAFFGALTSTAVYELINNDNINVDDVIDNLTDYLLYGMSK
ncbi:TetR family transcriptional regulator [Clostridium bovifaecis]|uniref:TetR family transcriptional regulator n=1 Tax=Clostridium bovifaecis TaxID=2184719 RepID=A0A6I6F7R1_9CLOT|nr:TetR family transcriptional regulator [Clostridium bovifaecis]